MFFLGYSSLSGLKTNTDLQTFKYEVIKANGQGWADLDAGGDAVDDPDGSAVRVARQGVGNDVVLHLPWRLGACLHPVNGLTGWTLQTPILKRQGPNFSVGNRFGQDHPTQPQKVPEIKSWCVSHSVMSNSL